MPLDAIKALHDIGGVVDTFIGTTDLKDIYLAIDSGSPTIENVQFVSASGHQIPFDPSGQGGENDDLSPSSSAFVSIPRIWGTVTGRQGEEEAHSAWNTLIAARGAVGVIAVAEGGGAGAGGSHLVTVGGTGSLSVRYGGEATSPARTYAAGESFMLGRTQVPGLAPVQVSISGTPSTALAAEVVEDAAHSAGETLMGMAERRIDSPATSAGTSGDWATANQDALGRSWVHGQNEGLDADDAAATANPHMMGGLAKSSDRAVVADADAVRQLMTLLGKMVNQPYALPGQSTSGTGSATNTSDTSVIAAPGAGIRLYITTLILANSSSTNITVAIKSGTTTRLTVPVPANSGCVVPLPVPLRLAANEALQFAASSGVTTAHCSAVGYTAGE